MIKIILAEDHNVVRYGIKSLLEQSTGMKIIGQVGSGIEVLELIDKGIIPDILVSDINMPQMNGLELLKEIKGKCPACKVIFLTMLDNELYINEAFDTGADGYLLKSITSDEMIFAVKHVSLGNRYICSELAMKLLNRVNRFRPKISDEEVKPEDFNERELEILDMIADGSTNEEIAEKLFMSKRTVEGYRKKMLEKTETRNSPALVRYALRHHIIE